MKTIDLCMVAWPRTAARLKYLGESLASFRRHVTASRHRIAAYASLETLDVSTANFRAAGDLCRLHGVTPRWRNMPPSLGGNQNDALMLGYGDYKLMCQDDWAWERLLDLSPDADFLDLNPDYAMIRHATFYTEFEPGYRLTPVDGKPRDEGGEFQIYHTVKMDGPFPYGDQPHLRRADFATRKSPTGGKPVGFFATEYGAHAHDNYLMPEALMAEHLRRENWRIAAHHPNVAGHIGTYSTSPLRQLEPEPAE